MDIQKTVEVVFGQAGKHSLPYLDSLAHALTDYHYEIVPEDFILKTSDMEEIKRIYCLEIMYRAHWASSASILRTHRWVHGVLLAAAAHNYLAFASSFRGLIESAGDIVDALMHVPSTFAEHFSIIRDTLEKKAQVVLDLSAIEEKLIHFTHARRLSKGHSLPSYQQHKTNTDYIKQLQDVGESMMIDCYSELCEIAHPAASSVMCFVSYDGKNVFTLNNKLDYTLIEDFCKRHKEVTERVLPLSITPAVCTLKILNLLRTPNIITPEVDLISLKVPAWAKIEALLSNQQIFVNGTQ